MQCNVAGNQLVVESKKCRNTVCQKFWGDKIKELKKDKWEWEKNNQYVVYNKI